MSETAQQGSDNTSWAVSLIWQGHMLDLLDKREEAIVIYKKAVDLNVNAEIRHSQFGMNYSPSNYAFKRIKEPFKRVENLDNE